MKYKSIEFTKKWNLGNYETHDVKIQAEVEENENIDEAFLKWAKRKPSNFYLGRVRIPALLFWIVNKILSLTYRLQPTT